MISRSILRRDAMGVRRRWEQQLSSALNQASSDISSSRNKFFNQYYKERRFTPVLEAFPLLDKDRFADGDLRAYSKIHDPKHVEQPKDPHVIRAGFFGPPNAGKSSLVNSLVGARVSAVSHKESTTVTWVKAVTNVHNTQLVLLDTPGLYPLQSEKSRRRHTTHTFAAWDALFSAQVGVFVLPAGVGFLDKEQYAAMKEFIVRSEERDLPVLLAISMFDKIRYPRAKQNYFNLRADIENKGFKFAATFETSSSTGHGLVDLKDMLARYATPAPWKYQPSTATDLPPPERAYQLIKQAMFTFLPHEVPHRTRHEVFGWTERGGGSVLEIACEVLLERPAYLAVFLSSMTGIRNQAEEEIGRELGNRKVRLVFFPFVSEADVKRSDR